MVNGGNRAIEMTDDLGTGEAESTCDFARDGVDNHGVGLTESNCHWASEQSSWSIHFSCLVSTSGLPVTTDTIDDLKIPLTVVVAVEAIRTVTTITTRRGGAVDIRPVAGTAPIGETHVHPAGPDIPKKEIPPTMDGSTLPILLPLQDPWVRERETCMMQDASLSPYDNFLSL